MDTTKTKTKRVRWEVAPDGGRWKVTRDGVELTNVTRKPAAIAAASSACRDEWKIRGIPSELIIKGKDGRIEDPRTYGLDPRSTKG